MRLSRWRLALPRSLAVVVGCCLALTLAAALLFACAGPEAARLSVTSTRTGNLFPAGETPRFRVSTNGTRLAWAVHGFGGTEVAKGTGRAVRGRYDFTAPQSRRGWYKLDVAVQGHGRQTVHTSFAVVPAPVIPPPDSPWGFAAHLGHGDGSSLNNPAATLPLLSASGVSMVRTDLKWDLVERRRGAYDFSAYEPALSDLRPRGITPVLILAYDNPLYDGGHTPYDAAGYRAFSEYAKAAVRRYQGLTKYYEVFNEYSGDFSNGPCARKPSCYVELLKNTYRAIKSVQPEAVVVGASTVGIQWDWLEEVFRLGGLKYMDVVAVHPYRNPRPPEGMEDDLRRIGRLIHQYNGGVDKPYWITEQGWSTSGGTQSVSESVQAGHLVRSQTLARAGGAGRSFWYDFVDDGVPDGATLDFGFGTVRNRANPAGAWVPKPSFVADAVMHHVLARAAYAGPDTRNTAKGVRSYVFRRGRTEIRVMWATGQPVRISTRAGSPVSVTDVMGNEVIKQPGGTEAAGTLTSDPVYVTGSISRIVRR